MSFKPWYEKQPDYVKSQAISMTYHKNQAIVEPDIEGKYLYVLLQGQADVLFQTIEGSHIVLSTYQPYSIFGELELFNEKLKTIGIYANGDVVVDLIPKQVFFQWMQEDFTLTKYLIAQLSDKLLESVEIHVRMLNLSIKDRIIYQLYTHHLKGDLASITKHDVVKELNVPIRSLNRSLAECSEEGLILWEKKHFKILDVDKLEDYVEMLDVK